MGNEKSKPATMEGDSKYMEKFSPGSTRFLELWKKKYGFEGKLTFGPCEKLVERLKIEALNSRKAANKELHLQLLEAVKW